MLGIQQQLRFRGVINHIQDTFQSRKIFRLHGSYTGSGVHSQGSRIDQYGSILVQIQIAVVVFAGTGNHNDLRPQFLKDCHSGVGGTSAAENQCFFAGNRNPRAQHQGPKSKVIGIVAIKRAVGSSHYGVHRAQPPSHRGKLIQKGNHIFFIGNCHVDSGEISETEEGFQLLGFLLKKRVIVGTQHAVNLGGVAVAQLSSQQTAFHQTTSV